MFIRGVLFVQLMNTIIVNSINSTIINSSHDACKGCEALYILLMLTRVRESETLLNNKI